jgi:hypothetical protein
VFANCVSSGVARVKLVFVIICSPPKLFNMYLSQIKVKNDPPFLKLEKIDEKTRPK